MNKALRLAALMLLSALPAAAEFCTLNGHSGSVVVERLKKPSCTMDNDLVVTMKANENRYGPDEMLRNPITLTGSWPGWGGADQKCAKARSKAESLVFSDETYVYGTTMLGYQIWKFDGSCDSLRSRFLSKQASLKKDSEPSLEDVLKALGAFEISKGDLGERLVEGKIPKKD